MSERFFWGIFFSLFFLLSTFVCYFRILLLWLLSFLCFSFGNQDEDVFIIINKQTKNEYFNFRTQMRCCTHETLYNEIFVFWIRTHKQTNTFAPILGFCCNIIIAAVAAAASCIGADLFILSHRVYVFYTHMLLPVDAVYSVGSGSHLCIYAITCTTRRTRHEYCSSLIVAIIIIW